MGRQVSLEIACDTVGRLPCSMPLGRGFAKAATLERTVKHVIVAWVKLLVAERASPFNLPMFAMTKQIVGGREASCQ